ncbi:MAG TPA: hypothetical protein ENI05_14780 [Porticoccus sp.]|nr:hypothetical protein [Porticoccus sp.]
MLASLEVSLVSQAEEMVASSPDFELLRLDSPAARILPLLELLASKRAAAIALPASTSQSLLLEVSPC